MDRVERLARDYAPALLSYLGRHSEPALHSAYELGRAALVDGLGLLDIVTVHNGVLSDVVSGSRPEEAATLVSAGGAFLVEVLSSFEMAQRAFQESVASAKAEGPTERGEPGRGGPHPDPDDRLSARLPAAKRVPDDPEQGDPGDTEQRART